MAALSNKDVKQGWIDSYYPYGQYMVQDNKLILGGDEIKVNNEILTQQVIKESTSGYNNAPASGRRVIFKKHFINWRGKLKGVKEIFWFYNWKV